MVTTDELRVDYPTNFPDEEYLQGLADHNLRQFLERFADAPIRRILATKGAFNVWTGHWLSDTSVSWDYDEEFPIDDLYLMGKTSIWRPHIEDCGRSPAKLRQLLETNAQVRSQFESVTPAFADVEILVCYRNDRYEIFDGMHRTVAAILMGKTTIRAYVVHPPPGGPEGFRPKCEKHVIGEFINPIIRGAINRSMKEVLDNAVAGLKFLMECYANIRPDLENWGIGNEVPDEKRDLALEVIERALD